MIAVERMTPSARVIAGICAIVGWVALALQYKLIADNLGVGAGLWRFVGYFTILTNIGVALVATAVALGGGSRLGWFGRLGGPRARLLAASSIVLVGLVYSLALRATWNPTGWQRIVDFALHDATPLLFVMTWILAPNGALFRRDFAWALVPPVAYAAYTLARGSIDGWYAYWFLDPSQQSLAELASSIAFMLAGFAVIAGLLVGVDKWLGKAEAEAGAESAN